MPVNLCEQTVSFISCFVVGIVMAFFYDVYGAFRYVCKIKKAFVFFFDSLFFILLAIAFFTALYITCGGKLRWFVVAGLLFGLLIYIFGASIAVRPVIEKQLLFLGKIFKKILYIFVFPFVRIRKFLCFILRPLAKFVQNRLKKYYFFVENTIEKLRRFIIKLIRYAIR